MRGETVTGGCVVNGCKGRGLFVDKGDTGEGVSVLIL